MVTMSSFGKFHRGSNTEFRSRNQNHSCITSAFSDRSQNPIRPIKIDPFSAYRSPADRVDGKHQRKLTESIKNGRSLESLQKRPKAAASDQGLTK